jgi:restriction endonuclease Mrr
VGVPDFQELMRPMLAQHPDGGEMRRKQIRESLARKFWLGSPEQEELLQSPTTAVGL